jgi:hypothetical protein
MTNIEFAGVKAESCPFCYGHNLAWETVEHNQALMYSVVCRNTDCFAQGPIDLGKSGAIAKWNTPHHSIDKDLLDEALNYGNGSYKP